MVGKETPKIFTSSLLGMPCSTASTTFILKSFEYAFIWAASRTLIYCANWSRGPKGATPNTKATMPDAVHAVAASRAPHKPHRTRLEDDISTSLLQYLF